MRPTWQPLKRGPEEGGYSRLWWENGLIALVAWFSSTINLFLWPFGLVTQWEYCMVDWWAQRAALRDREAEDLTKARHIDVEEE